MTIDEYNAEFARCQRWMIWRMVYSIAIIFGALALANGVRYFDGELADSAHCRPCDIRLSHAAHPVALRQQAA
jgi:hypothetical protein